MHLRCEQLSVGFPNAWLQCAPVLCPEVNACVLLMDTVRAVGHLLNEWLPYVGQYGSASFTLSS